jgi:hypothetical protein
MLKNILITTTSLLVSWGLWAQDYTYESFPTEDVQWRSLSVKIEGPDTLWNLNFFQFTKDTTIDSESYRILQRSENEAGTANAENYLALRTTDSGQKVFVRYLFPNAFGDDEILLYDYTLQKGDTFYRRVLWNGLDTTLLCKVNRVRTFTNNFNFGSPIRVKTKMMTLRIPGMGWFEVIPREFSYAYWGETIYDPFFPIFDEDPSVEQAVLECFIQKNGHEDELAGICDLAWADSLAGNEADTSVAPSMLESLEADDFNVLIQNGELLLDNPSSETLELQLFDLNGRLIVQTSLPPLGARLSLVPQLEGLYVLRISNNHQTLKTVKLCLPN